jgi:class 3 adenylate cyclase/Tfp pilus assembly protein PilF
LREIAQQDLIRLLARTGQTSDALRQYREFERLLKQELDAVPSSGTRTLAEQLAAGAATPAVEQRNEEATSAPAPVREQPGASPAIPTGTVTFLLTDIEGSTRLWEQYREAMGDAVARHDDLAASAIARFRGTLLKRRGEGDSLFAVFSRARDAVNAAFALQQALQSEPWPSGIPIRVRMAAHTGEAELRDGDYYGPDVNRCARLRATATGGQILLSQSTRNLTGDALPTGTSLRDLGERPLRDLERPERVYQLIDCAASDLALGKERGKRRLASSSPSRPFRPVAPGSREAIGGLTVAPSRRLLLAIVGCVLLLLLGLAARPKVEARWRYWKGHDAWNERTERGFQRARRYFEEAIARDPGYAAAYTGLADTYLLLGYYSYLPPKEAALGASQATREAMERDKGSAGAYAARAMAAMIFDWNWEDARANFARAIDLDPSYATARQWYSLFLIVQGPREKSMEEIGRAGGLDISSRVISKSAGGRYYYLGQYDDAIERCNETIKLDPNYSLAHYWLGLALTQKRDYKTAEKAIQDGYWLSSDAANFDEALKGFRGSAGMLASLGHLYAVSGQKAKAEKILERLHSERARGPRYVSAVGIASVYVGLGKRDRAIQWLETGLTERACEMIFLHVDPVFAPLDRNSRFLQILGAIGLPRFPRAKSG